MKRCFFVVKTSGAEQITAVLNIIYSCSQELLTTCRQPIHLILDNIINHNINHLRKKDTEEDTNTEN